MRRLSCERIPLAFAVAFVAACFVVTVWNFSVAALFPRLSVRNWNPIYGLAEETSPGFTLANFLSGDLQAAFSRRIGTSLPIYAPAIRLRNQIEYSIFGLPNAPSIAFGRDKRLYEWAYITEYCGRSGEENPAEVGRWADKIKDIQDYATSQGKTFVYLITPSKAATYPQYLPDAHPCPAASRGRSRSFLHTNERLMSAASTTSTVRASWLPNASVME
jgi:hypothetical protein